MVLIVNTGGTFNKIYNHITGELEVIFDGSIIQDILHEMRNFEYRLVNILQKDSKDMTTGDREKIAETIKEYEIDRIIVIHGTDTMHKSAEFLESRLNDRMIIMTGAMVPYAIDRVEATANLSMAIGFMQNEFKEGVFISMQGAVCPYKKLVKNVEKGHFEKIND